MDLKHLSPFLFTIVTINMPLTAEDEARIVAILQSMGPRLITPTPRDPIASTERPESEEYTLVDPDVLMSRAYLKL